LIAIPAGSERDAVHDEVSEDRKGHRAPPGTRRLVPIAIAFAVALVGLVMWLLTSGTGSLRQLPSEERAALYQRTLANLHDICRANDRPREFCKEQASLLLSLPECEQACQADARQELLADTAVK
jgi:hypothetical protein